MQCSTPTSSVRAARSAARLNPQRSRHSNRNPDPVCRPLATRRASGRSERATAAGATAAGYDYDLIILGCGVGGHGAALHAVEQGMKVAVVEGHDVGGTCVNRGCVPSKALLAASGRVREMRDDMHLKAMGIQVRPQKAQRYC